MSHYTIHQDDDTSKPVHEYRWSLLKDGKTIGEFFTQADAETIRAALNGANEAKGLVALWCADATADEAGIPEAEEQQLWVTAGILRARAGQRRIDAAELKAALLFPSLQPQLPDAPHFIKVIQLLIAEMRASRFEPVRLCADQLQAAISQQDTRQPTAEQER